jgi:signal transduction histidine kinase
MTSLSLKWRVSLWVSTVMVAVIATICIVAYVEFQESHLRNLDRMLLAMANGIAASLDDHQGTEELMKDVRSVTGRPGWNPSTFYRIWKDGSSTDLLASDTPDSKFGRWLRELPDQESPSREEPTFVNMGRPRDEYRAVWIREKTDEGTANIVVAGPSHHTYHEMYEFERLLIVLGGSLILGSVVAVMWTVRCGLRPIHVTAERLHHISRPNAGKALFDDLKVPEELHPFVEALKDMLARLNQVFQQQKQFTSDAAHELRTPLALAKSTLQVAQMNQRDAGEYRQAIADVLKDIARMESLTEQLLVLARMDEANERTAAIEVQLDVLLSELAEAFGKKIQSSGGQVILEEPPATSVRGNLDELVRLFSNVLDNATKYGPPNGTVRITFEHHPDSYVTVHIHDEGGNIPATALPHLCERFYRVDPSRSSSTGGAGLGLAIAQEIARHHDGSISITSDPSSGTLVSIRLRRV